MGRVSLRYMVNGNLGSSEYWIEHGIGRYPALEKSNSDLGQISLTGTSQLSA